MHSLLSIARSRRVDSSAQIIDQFESLSDLGQVSIDEFWGELGPNQPVSLLASLIKVDLRRRFERGERPKVAEYFDRFPSLIESRDRVVSLVYEEFCLLTEAGDDPDSQRFCDDYEPWRDSLVSQLAYHRDFSLAVGSEPTPVRFPAPGERFGGFRLHSILGRGGVARVYLATEDELGDRKVALKVASSFGQELSILANLDHRNIVPILSVVESESGLRGFCMPYRPGMTLEELIQKLGNGRPPRSAQAIWDQIKPPNSADSIGPVEKLVGWESFPVSGSSGEAIAWIGLALANALIYLHDRGVLHRDVKPANVLLALSEGPQLLDFNLSQNPNSAEQASAAMKGGTLPYMAPEQLQAFLDPIGWKSVNSSADIYSLGLVLRQLLTGLPPDVPRPGASLNRMIAELLDRRALSPTSSRDINPDIPPSLDAIIARCLAFSPVERYQSASELAEDLSRFLDRRPLRFAPNPSKLERIINWTHRYRRGILTAIMVLMMGGLIWFSSIRTPVHKLSAFRDAVHTLESNQPADWQKARVEFERLHREYRESAWPSLYLGLTLEKIGGSDSLPAHVLFREAGSRSDFPEALDFGLKQDPSSSTLWAIKGYWSWASKKYTVAREDYGKAIQFDPNRINALLGMVNVERDSHHDADAIRYCLRAIEIAVRDKAGDSKCYYIRVGLIPLLATEANRLIDEGQTVQDRTRSTPFLDLLDQNLVAIARHWANMPQNNGWNMHQFTHSFYQGSLSSCRAVLLADSNQFENARQLLTHAREKFRQARHSTPPTPETRKLLEAQESSLERRLREIDRIDMAQPATGNPDRGVSPN